jgi:hypothetical protein
MQLALTWLVVSLFAAAATQAAVVYKWTDADGVVHYSDQPVPGAQRILTPSNPSNASNSSNPLGSAQSQPNAVPNKAQPTAAGYTLLAIESPSQNEVFFGDQPIPVRLRLDPDLEENRSITWYLNGTPLDDQGTNSLGFTLQSLSRGEYGLVATVTNLKSGVAQSTASVTFYVRQPSELSPQHRRP